ncbi:MAG: hypothetical protein WB762_00270 [Candidatus Sulfotelmatobacter sp.]
MSATSPTVEGFRVAFRRPSLTLAEIAWRWAPGFTAAALWLFYFIEYFNTLPVTHTDLVLLSSRQPALIARAIAHIFHGSLDRAVLAAWVLAVGLSLLWSIAASVGRLATVSALLAYFRSTNADNLSTRTDRVGKPRPLRALIQLNFLRVVVVLAMLLSIGGAAILSRLVSTDSQPRPGLAFVLFVLSTACIWIAGWALNWWLSLAAVFVVREGEDALGAFSRAVSFFHDRTGAVIAVSTWTGLAHCVAFSIAATAASVPLAFLQVAPWRVVIAGVALVTLAYFAVVDWLYMARLAGYVCLTETPDTLLVPPLLPPPLPSFEPPDTAIDRDEPILSDLPNLAVQP